MLFKFLMLLPTVIFSVCLEDQYECSYFANTYFCSFNEDCYEALGLNYSPPPSSPPLLPPSPPPAYLTDCNLCFEYVRSIDYSSGN